MSFEPRTLVIGLASRGRPKLLKDTVEQTIKNIAAEATQLWLLLDVDDVPSRDVAAQLETAYPRRIYVNYKNREDTVGAKFNRMLATPADVYMSMVDHSPHITPAFDKAILDAAMLFEDGVGVVYNQLENASFPGLNALTAKWVKLTGYFYPPYFPFWWIDHWIDDLARMTGRLTYADVKIDASRKPPTQGLSDEPEWWATWFDAGYRFRRKLAHDIIWNDALDWSYAERKRQEKNYLGIDLRSRWINEHVRAGRQQFAQMKLHDADRARYQRTRVAAVAMLPSLLILLPVDEQRHYRALLTPPEATDSPLIMPSGFTLLPKRM